MLKSAIDQNEISKFRKYVMETKHKYKELNIDNQISILQNELENLPCEREEELLHNLISLEDCMLGDCESNRMKYYRLWEPEVAKKAINIFNKEHENRETKIKHYIVRQTTQIVEEIMTLIPTLCNRHKEQIKRIQTRQDIEDKIYKLKNKQNEYLWFLNDVFECEERIRKCKIYLHYDGWYSNRNEWLKDREKYRLDYESEIPVSE